jgi:hypothetical protein
MKPRSAGHLERWAKEPLLMRVINTLLAVTVLCAASASVFAKDFPIVHPNEITAKYGKPDRIQSTEYDKPRPPFVTRMLEYKKEHVRFIFLPTAQIGSPPPYSSWYLLGTQDPRDNSVISAQEAAKRMQARAKK